MTSLELARTQFGITTIYHFLFVPLTIGLAAFVALCQTRWYRTGDERWLRATRFWGKLMLISFALGVATGIVQEFQFGMNWADYSRFVGDVFGAPLAMEGLAAFFVESTFLGLWLFGWGRLSPRVHLATIWLVSFSTALSAYFIIAANSWMQHPVGYEMDKARGRAHLTDIFAVLGNSTAIRAYLHVLVAAAMTAGGVVVAVSAWHLLRGRNADVLRPSLKLALPVVAVAAVLSVVTGHFQGTLLVEQQPMKMAAAEALWETEQPAALSVFATGDFTRNPGGTNRNIKIPHVLSLLADGTWNGEVRGMNEVNAEYVRRYGPGDYVPIVGVVYWSFRAMAGVGTVLSLLMLAGLWLTRRGRDPGRLWLKLALFAAALPFIANTAGWMMTEIGRQPWVVQGLQFTRDGVSPTVSSAQVIISLSAFTLVYGVLAVIALRLFLRFAKAGPPAPAPSEAAPQERPADDLALAY